MTGEFLCDLYDGGRRAASNSYQRTGHIAADAVEPFMLDIIFLGGGIALLLLMVAYEALCRRL